jgi:uncharacterized protein YhbP (UPF0306 family)
MKRRILSMAIAMVVLMMANTMPAYATMVGHSAGSVWDNTTITNILQEQHPEGRASIFVVPAGRNIIFKEFNVIESIRAFENPVVENGVLKGIDFVGEWSMVADDTLNPTLIENRLYALGDFAVVYVVDATTAALMAGSETTTEKASSTEEANSAAENPVNTPTNFVATANVNVRSEAKLLSDITGGFKKGSPVNVIEQTNRLWYKVQYTDSTIGYVSALFVTGFDSAYYAAQNSDVVSILGDTFDDLYGHYVRHGKTEGRSPFAGWTP